MLSSTLPYNTRNLHKTSFKTEQLVNFTTNMSKFQQKVIPVSRILAKTTHLGSPNGSSPPVTVPLPFSISKKSQNSDSSSSPSTGTGASHEYNQPRPPPMTSDMPLRDQHINFNWPVPDLTKPQYIWKAGSTLTLFTVGLWSKSVMSLMNKTKILNKDRMSNAIFNRPEGTALVTVSNHESCIDDPTLLTSFMTLKQLTDQKRSRWSFAAYDICYRTKLSSSFFTLGKCAPVLRGAGVYQKAVDFAIERVNAGDWIHIFPEGCINTERKDLYRLKWGIGRILSECRTPVMVIPFWHTGMSKVLPNHQPYIPRFGKDVLINVGEPIDISEVLRSIHGKSTVERRKTVTDFIQRKLKLLREETMDISSRISATK